MYKIIRSFTLEFKIKNLMLHYLKKYPLTWLIVFTILYLSFFKPPQTDMEEIPGIDKLVQAKSLSVQSRSSAGYPQVKRI